jgi:protein TonB
MEIRPFFLVCALLLGACQSPLIPVAASPLPEPADTFAVLEVDRAPKPAARLQRPNYPLDMRRAGIRGEVIVRFVVTPEGKVINATAIKATSATFAVEAVKAVSRWSYEPALKDGLPVYCRMELPIMFKLNEL